MKAVTLEKAKLPVKLPDKKKGEIKPITQEKAKLYVKPPDTAPIPKDELKKSSLCYT